MNNPLYDAFDQIKATDALKHHTAATLHSKLQEHPVPAHRSHHLAFTALLFLLLTTGTLGSYSLFLAPVSYISIDVNPSIELTLNRLDRVVSVQGYNEEGNAILQQLRLQHVYYTDAVETILVNETFSAYLTEDAALTFTVVSAKEDSLQMGIQGCRGYAEHGGACHGGGAQIVKQAHHSQMSVGKYRAFLELSQYDNTITPEEFRTLSMREIQDRIAACSGKDHNSNKTDHGNHHGPHHIPHEPALQAPSSSR
ncbi:MAG: hypothetical protein RSB57_03235 [Hungatella sp.]